MIEVDRSGIRCCMVLTGQQRPQLVLDTRQLRSQVNGRCLDYRESRAGYVADQSHWRVAKAVRRSFGPDFFQRVGWFLRSGIGALTCAADHWIGLGQNPLVSPPLSLKPSLAQSATGVKTGVV